MSQPKNIQGGAAVAAEQPATPSFDPARGTEPNVHHSYDADPMTPNPTMLSRIAASLTTGNPDPTVNAWATAFQAQYPSA